MSNPFLHALTASSPLNKVNQFLNSRVCSAGTVAKFAINKIINHTKSDSDAHAILVKDKILSLAVNAVEFDYEIKE